MGVVIRPSKAIWWFQVSVSIYSVLSQTILRIIDTVQWSAFGWVQIIASKIITFSYYQAKSASQNRAIVFFPSVLLQAMVYMSLLFSYYYCSISAAVSKSSENQKNKPFCGLRNQSVIKPHNQRKINFSPGFIGFTMSSNG